MKRIKRHEINKKTNSKVVNTNPNTSVITLRGNGLNIPVKVRDYQTE